MVEEKWTHVHLCVKLVCVDVPTSHLSMRLLAFAAERRPLSIDLSRPPAWSLLLWPAPGQTDRRTDGRTSYRFIDPAAQYASSVKYRAGLAGGNEYI